MKIMNAIVVPPLHSMARRAIPGPRTRCLVGAGIGSMAFLAAALLPTLAYGGIETLERPSGAATLVVLGIVLAVTAVLALIVAVLVEQVPAAARPTRRPPIDRRSRPRALRANTPARRGVLRPPEVHGA